MRVEGRIILSSFEAQSATLVPFSAWQFLSVWLFLGGRRALTKVALALSRDRRSHPN